MTRSPQMASLMGQYGVTTQRALVRAIRNEYNRECVEPGEPKFSIFDAEVILDGLLEAEYQRLQGAQEVNVGNKVTDEYTARVAAFATGFGPEVPAEQVPALVREGRDVWSFGYGVDSGDMEGEDGEPEFTTISDDDLWAFEGPDADADVVASWAPFRTPLLGQHPVVLTSDTTVRTRYLTFDVDGRSERGHIDLGRHVTWMHELGNGSAHGSSAKDEAEALAMLIADVTDPECYGRSTYLLVRSDKTGTVHELSRSSGRDPLVGEGASGRCVRCGHTVLGVRLSERDAWQGESKVCRS